jgi:hypothetical protein
MMSAHTTEAVADAASVRVESEVLVVRSPAVCARRRVIGYGNTGDELRTDAHVLPKGTPAFVRRASR